jgi:hypothetical protein
MLHECSMANILVIFARMTKTCLLRAADGQALPLTVPNLAKPLILFSLLGYPQELWIKLWTSAT